MLRKGLKSIDVNETVEFELSYYNPLLKPSSKAHLLATFSGDTVLIMKIGYS